MTTAAVGPLSPGLPSPESAGATAPRTGDLPFGKVLNQLLENANSEQLHADQAVQDFAVGNTQEVHGVMLALAKADLSLHTVLEVRNRLVDAYQEVMRMSI